MITALGMVLPFFLISGLGTHALPLAVFTTLSSSALFAGM